MTCQIDNINICTKCYPGYSLTNGACVKCNNFTLTCLDGNLNVSLTCIKGYTIQINRICASCSSQC